MHGGLVLPHQAVPSMLGEVWGVGGVTQCFYDCLSVQHQLGLILQPRLLVHE